MTRRWLVIAFVLGLVLAGCVNVTSEHPLSDDGDSVVDERLIGWWEVVPPPNDDEAQQRFALVVGRRKGRDTTLEFVLLHLDENDYVGVERFAMHTIRKADTWYLSVRTDDGTFMLFRYTVDGAGSLVLEELDADTVAAAIEGKQIAGRVKRAAADSANAGDLQEVRLSAGRDVLRTWIGGAGASVWQRTPAWKSFQRLPRELPTVK